MARRLRLVAACVCAGYAVGALTTNASVVGGGESPHVVFVVVDDMGYGDIGYNDRDLRASTPTLDRLALEGVKLTSFYVSPTCTASRAALLTGKYPMHLGLQDSVIHPSEPRGVPLAESLLSSKLSSAGYFTVFVGKWHLGFHQRAYTPTQRGFDEFFGILTGGGDHVTHVSTQTYAMRGPEYKLKTNVYSGTNLWWNDAPVAETDAGVAGAHSTHLYTTKAVAYVSKASKAPTRKPLFLVVSYQAVHAPIQVPDEYLDGTVANGCDALVCRDSQGAVSSSQTRLRRSLCGMVSMVDESVLELAESLKETGMWDSTVLFFLSDNGGILRHGSSNGALRGEKGSYYEGGIKVPAFVSGGYTANALQRAGTDDAAGRSFAGLVHVTDLHVTVLALAKGAHSQERRLQSQQPPPQTGAASADASQGTQSAEKLFPVLGEDVPRAETALDEVSARETYTADLDGVDQWSAIVSGASAAASARSHIAHNINSELFGSAGALRVGEYKLIVEARVTESEIYEYGQHMLQDDSWDQSELSQVIHQKLLRTPGQTSLFNVVKNPNELDDASLCSTGDDVETCRDLYELESHATLRETILDKWLELVQHTPESTEIWLDDGPLADPAIFGGVWTPWRDDLGMPYATYQLATKSIHASLGGDNAARPASTADATAQAPPAPTQLSMAPLGGTPPTATPPAANAQQQQQQPQPQPPDARRALRDGGRSLTEASTNSGMTVVVSLAIGFLLGSAAQSVRRPR